MRADDVIECAAFGFTPKQALRNALIGSIEAHTVMIDGRAEAMLGLVVTNALTGLGSPWLLASDVLYDHGRSMLCFGQMLLHKFSDSTPHLANLVSADNHRAIRLLRRWGFVVEAETIMKGDVAFHHFHGEHF